MKTALRWLLFHLSWMFSDGEFYAESGTLKFRFLNWLYDGECEPMFDCQYPE
jgi:hypothetical protein